MITRVGIVGCGVMGSGIACVSALAALDVVAWELDHDRLNSGRQRIQDSLDRGVKSGRIDRATHQRAFGMMRFTTDLTELADRELVIEAVVEEESVKVDMFSELDRIIESEEAILASNTSSVPIMRLAMATARPGRVLGMHFFNPVAVRPLVELISSLLTSDQTATIAQSFVVEQLNKRVITSKDRAGFVVNALLVPYLLSAVRMLESGFATASDIDDGMVDGCAHPMGPLALLDLIGLDTAESIASALYLEFKEPLYASPPLLSRMVEAGILGRKSGRGFYTYNR